MDNKKPLGGLKMVADAVNTCVYRADPSIGTYNHASMLQYHDAQFLLTWKNSPENEDTPGQRILFSQSLDGNSWTPTTGNNIMFPNMSTNSNQAALFANPPIVINGRLYAGASPIQMCLYPDQYASVLLLRQVMPGLGNFGQAFWATASVPKGFEAASASHNVTTLPNMDAQTQADISTLTQTSLSLPCAPSDGTTKCEACAGGCQLWSEVSGTGNERTHYTVPGSNGTDGVILYRTKDNNLFASTRKGTSQAAWTHVAPTDMPNDNANLNAGEYTQH